MLSVRKGMSTFLIVDTPEGWDGGWRHTGKLFYIPTDFKIMAIYSF